MLVNGPGSLSSCACPHGHLGTDAEKVRAGVGRAVSGSVQGSLGMRLSLCRNRVPSGGVRMGEWGYNEVERISETSIERSEVG